ncbi:MAG: hypothetical protein ACJ8KA_02840 [Sulfurifustis sp.]
MRRFGLGAIFSLLLVGCATPYRIPLSPDAKESVQSTSAVVMLRQEEIVADFIPAIGGAAAGAVAGIPGIGILIAAAAGAAEGAVLSNINAGRAKDAEKQAMPVRDALIDYDFRAQFQAALNRELSNVAWLKLGEIKYDSPDTKLQDLKQKTTQNQLLLLNVSYALTPELRGFRLTSVVVAHPNDDRLKAIASKERPNEDPSLLYRNTFVYTHPLPVPYESADKAAQAWSANKGEAIRTALNNGIAEMARLIAMDMQMFDQPKPAGDGAKTETYSNVAGVVVSETGDRVVLRLPNGSLRSLSKSETPEMNAGPRRI